MIGSFSRLDEQDRASLVGPRAVLKPARSTKSSPGPKSTSPSRSWRVSIIVLTLRAARIEEITAFRSPELFPLFGLPEQLPT